MKKILSFAFCCIALTVNAQTFIAPSAAEYDYPPFASSTNVIRPDHLSCYYCQNVSMAGVVYDLQISAWDSRGAAVASGIAWRRFSPGVTTSALNEGFINYSHSEKDLEVGFIQTTNGVQAIVAYWKPGVGHFYDIYSWGLSGLTLTSSTQISTLTSYSRISTDGINRNSLIIAWTTGNGVQVIAAQASGATITFGPTILLTGTSGASNTDVALSLTGNNTNAHFVYQQASSIIESEVPFAALFSGSSFPPIVQDINPAPIVGGEINMDCPDQNNFDDWCYVYAPSGYDIKTRIVNNAVSSTPNTYCHTDGSLGTASINTFLNSAPTVAYNLFGNFVYVGWFTFSQDPPFTYPMLPTGQGSYIAQQLNKNGTLASPVFLQVNNNIGITNSGTPSICFCKQQFNGTNLASIYSYFGNTTPPPPFGYNIENKYISWSASTFRQSATTGVTATTSYNDVKAFPNPFSTQLFLAIPESMNQKMMKIVITDMSGRVVNSVESVGSNVNNVLGSADNNLVKGTYLISVKVPELNYDQSLKVTKL